MIQNGSKVFVHLHEHIFLIVDLLLQHGTTGLRKEVVNVIQSRGTQVAFVT
jgi:hypothetical protein